jgi:CubicO group peptidase (beta-lactamase class C family)
MKKILLSLSMLLFAGVCFAQKFKDKSSAVDTLFKKYAAAGTSGISVMVIQDGKAVYNRSFGNAEVSTGRKVTPSTNYRIASVTKSFTAMAVLILRDEGKLALEDKLSKFFSGLPSFADSITVHQMLVHTSGLITYGNSVPKDLSRPMNDYDVLEIVKKQDSTNFKPGTKFRYSNTAYVLLGLIVEKVSGMGFDAFLNSKVFKPLKMSGTVFNNVDGKILNRAYGYNERDGKLLLEDQSEASYLRGDGGIYSSVKDFFLWDQALYSDKLVKATTMKEIFTPGAYEAPGLGYGFGWYIEKRFGMDRISHSGGTTGFSSYYVRYPEKKFSIVVFGNQDEGLALDPIVSGIEKIYLQ